MPFKGRNSIFYLSGFMSSALTTPSRSIKISKIISPLDPFANCSSVALWLIWPPLDDLISKVASVLVLLPKTSIEVSSYLTVIEDGN